MFSTVEVGNELENQRGRDEETVVIAGDERGGDGVRSTLCGPAWRRAGGNGRAAGQLSAGCFTGHASRIRRTFRIFRFHAAGPALREASPDGCAVGPLACLRHTSGVCRYATLSQGLFSHQLCNTTL